MMDKIKTLLNKISNQKKITIIISLLIIGLFLVLAAPSLARLIRNTAIDPILVWDGSIATSYRNGDGSENNPYIISNGSELAYFQSQLETLTYENTYFKLNNNIILNNGIFNYSQSKEKTYILDNQKYYIKDNTTEYYDNLTFSETKIGDLNNFFAIKNFKGHLDGQGNSIFGLYMIGESDELALFTNLEGTLSNIYFDNIMINGGKITAGIAVNLNNATINNVLVDGFVINKNDEFLTTKTYEILDNNLILNETNPSSTIDLNLDFSKISKYITNTKLTGKIVINEPAYQNKPLTINNQPVIAEDFEIDLGTSLTTNLIVTSSSINAGDEFSISLSDLQYHITYNNSIVSGLFANVTNSTITSSINKAYLEGNLIGGGLIGQVKNNLILDKSYSDGYVSATKIAGGLIGQIMNNQDESTITACYNNSEVLAEISGGLIGSLQNNTGTINIQKSFNATLIASLFGKTENISLNSNKVYYLTDTIITPDLNVTGDYIETNLDFLKDKNNLINQLNMIEYDENTQSGDWIFNSNELPKLYFDGDINKPLINIFAGSYSWSDFKTNLAIVKFNNNITFSIEKNNELSKVKDIYYYISNQTAPLSIETLNEITEWTPYEDIITITDKGYYVIYAKYIDQNNNEGYINSQLLVLGNPDSDASLTLNDVTWTTFSENLNNIYIDNSVNLYALANNYEDGIKSIKYFISDTVLNSLELAEVPESNWTLYENQITINATGKYIVYLEITSNDDQKNYINSDIIIYQGYQVSNLTVGNETLINENIIDITAKSLIKMDFKYSGDVINETDYNHILRTNQELPLLTKIILIDNLKNKVYYYKVENLKTIYSFEAFKEIGTNQNYKYYTEDLYIVDNYINEDFTIILDFAEADILTSYENITLAINILNQDNKLIRPTLASDLKSINIYYESDAYPYLNGNPLENDIYLNRDSLNTITINTGVNYILNQERSIKDSTLDNQKIGISFKLVDSNNQLIAKNYLKNLIVKYNNQVYHFGSDNMIHIKLSEITAQESEITIITIAENNELAEGQYYLKINSYLSNDGYIIGKTSLDEIVIPLINEQNNQTDLQYSFDVIIDESKRIINKNVNENMAFSILQNGNLINPNIKVSLFKKEVLSAYNQNYTLIDLKSYITEDLEIVSDMIYYALKNPLETNDFNLTFLANKLENNSYKLVFELYDSNQKLGTIEKFFIVK